MPELPEVETMCRGIAACVGRQIQAVSTPPCRYRPISIQPSVASLQRKLRGQVIAEVSRLGKRVVLQTADLALLLQPKMSGLVVLQQPPDDDHIRLQIDFAGQPPLRLQFWDRRGLGTVELISRTEIESRIVAGRLGPDALAISGEEFSRRLAKTTRPIKVALLDQKLLAGIGNLYASEMLHVARIHPQTPCAAIGPRKVAALFEAMRSILLSAIAHEGSTLSDGTYRNALNNPGSYQSQHRVYGRAGLACPSCRRGKIERIVQGGRSTFYCPNCQRQRPAR